MNPVSVDIKDLLVTAGFKFADASDFSIHINTDVDSPDDVVVIFDTGGPEPWGVLDRSVKRLLRPTFQIRVRADAYKKAQDKLEEINNLLERRGSFTAISETSSEPDVRYTDLFTTGDPLPLGRDDNNRFLWVTNYQAYRKEKV